MISPHYIRRRLALLGGLAAILVIGPVACGGDDGESTRSQLTKAAFIKQADEICEETNDEYLAAYKGFAKANGINASNLPTPAQADEITEKLYIPMMARRVAALEKLGLPAGSEKQAKAILSAMEDGIATASGDIGSVTRGSTDVFGKAKLLSRRYGLKVCSL